MARRIFHLDLDAFFVSVEQALAPSLKGKPVVVRGDPRYRGVVACASYEARRYGLKAGMPLSIAKRLCPHAIFIAGRFSRYQEFSERFMAILGDYSPDLEPMGLDEAYLDMTGFEPIYGPPAMVGERIRERVHRELGITVSIGIASTKVAAKVAADICKPDGLLEVPPGPDASFLAPLDIEQLPGAGGKTGQALRSLGCRTIGELAAMSPAVVRRVLGVWGDVLQLWANGLDDRPVVPPAPVKSISRETTFAEDIHERNLLRATLAYLGERVGASLRREGKLARCVQIKVRYSSFETITRQTTLAMPADADGVILKAGLELLTRTLNSRREKVRLLGIGVADLIKGGRQMALLGNREVRLEALDRAIDRLRGRYGFTALQRGMTLPLGQLFAQENHDYLLKTTSLSR